MSKRLLVKKQDIEIPELTQEIPANGIITVGSDSTSTLELLDPNIAAEQFVIVCEEDKMTLLSRASGNLINGNILSEGALHQLEIGDEIKIADFTIEAQSDEQPKPNSNKKKSKKPKPANLSKSTDSDSSDEDFSDSSDKFHHSLSGVLASLRTEEKFYFQISNGVSEASRYYVEGEEMILGWTPEGLCYLTSADDEHVIPHSIIRKDWTGVVLSPLKPKSVWVNNEPVAESRRLKNDDRITIAERDSKKPSELYLIRFNEPTALLALDSILPKELPPPILLDEHGKSLRGDQISSDDDKNIHSSQTPSQTQKTKRKRLFFGYFTLTEIVIMTIGTLITAAIVFLILELY